MKKYMKALGVIAIAGAFALGLSACGEIGSTNSKNPYEVARSSGYEGTLGNWMSETTGSESEAKRLFEEAKEYGYTGTFLEFLKEMGYGGESALGVNGALASTVMVVSSFQRQKENSFFNSTEDYSSTGAGIIYSLDKEQGSAYIVTNYHVLYSNSSLGRETVKHISDDVVIYLYGGVVEERGISATYVGGAMEYDIAVLKVESDAQLKDENCIARAAKIGNSDAITVGETVYAIGNPNAEGFSVTSGIVSVGAEYIDITLANESATVDMLEIRTDAPINHGNSGGGLYDREGKLVGIVNARSEQSGIENFGYAIPVNLAISVAQNIIDNSTANSSKGAFRAMLGITVQVTDSRGAYDETTGKVFVMQTVTVQEVTLGGMAYGKLQSGDVLYSLQIGDGHERIVTRMHMLTNAMFDVRKGDTVKIKASRGEELIEVEISYDSDSAFTLYA